MSTAVDRRITDLTRQRAEIEGMLLKGATEIAYGDQRVRIDTADQLRARLAYVDAQIRALTDPRRAVKTRRIVVSTSKGL
ncbi:MAG: hypothetical protein ACT6Q8_24330 [Niveispirillum sp.]|uniref:hypothetical protein n=1 Tax=Niveispirillum sp. TaxID=1917217 RepID=UPI0040363657